MFFVKADKFENYFKAINDILIAERDGTDLWYQRQTTDLKKYDFNPLSMKNLRPMKFRLFL